MEKEFVKRAVVAGAAAALKYKERNPKATESEIMSHVIKEIKRILREIDEDE